MQVPVLVEAVPGKGYQATASDPLALTAQGPTREEALQELRNLIDKRMATGAQLIMLDIPSNEHPWARFAGTWTPGDPFIDMWKQAVEDYRRKMDEDPNVP